LFENFNHNFLIFKIIQNPQEKPWEYLRIFLKTLNPQEMSSKCKIRRKILKNTCGFFSAGKPAGK
jgi:hypothetical protein